MSLSALLRPCVRPAAAALLACLLSSLMAGVSAAESTTAPRTSSPAATDKPVIAGDLLISAAWARATVASAPVGAAYFTVTNRGHEADALLAATSPVAASITLHQTTHTGGMARMHESSELVIAPGKQLRAEPNGLHLMLNGLRQPLVAGQTMPLALKFRRTGTVNLQVQVIPIAAAAPQGMAH
jgi:copper(I)-binding protein